MHFKGIFAKDPVLWLSGALAVVSCALARPPAAAYAEYIDWKTPGCLVCLMAASGGFRISGLFDAAAERLAAACGSARGLTAAMTAGTFAASMFITNDVALIVFVPMTLIAFRRTGRDPVLTVVLQTLAANIGSILLPMGNPQNLYLYSRHDMTFGPFLRAVLPLSLAGAALLALLCLRVAKAPVDAPAAERARLPGRSMALYCLLFCAAVSAVFDVIDYRISLALTVAALFVKGRELALQIDCALLLTFIFFFIFVGNIGNVPAIDSALTSIVAPHPYLAAAAASQFISNVPAAVLLSRFTEDGYALLAGVSAGSCGTLVASMASLISYKLYMRDGGREGGRRRRYLREFTLLNILFLAVLTLVHAVMKKGAL